MREVLVSCREKFKKIIADFHVLGLFMAKKHVLSDFFFPKSDCTFIQQFCIKQIPNGVLRI
jgi:hypothetical protein